MTQPVEPAPSVVVVEPIENTVVVVDDGAYVLEAIREERVVVGGVGMPGPTGPQGPVGPQGPLGPKGEDGTKRFHGDGPPGTIIGASPGDEYLDRTTGELYILQ